MIFRRVTAVVLATNTLMNLCYCLFFCGNKKATRMYDRLFFALTLLILVNIIGYFWMVWERFRHAGAVCSGDIARGRDDIAFDEMYYINGFGTTLYWYIVIETVLNLLCCCSTVLWVCNTPNAYQRFFTTVEH